MAERDTLATMVLTVLARDRRRAVSLWRILILLQRMAARDRQPIPDRDGARTVVRRLIARGDLQRVRELRDVYRVTSPFAEALPLSDEQILQEANPLGFFSHLTALVHHGLTDVLPGQIYMTSNPPDTRRLPLETTPEDWVENDLPRGQPVPELGDIRVIWSKTLDDSGVVADHSHGGSFYVTDLERTLLDALRDPAKARGLPRVLEAWRWDRSFGTSVVFSCTCPRRTPCFGSG